MARSSKEKYKYKSGFFSLHFSSLFFSFFSLQEAGKAGYIPIYNISACLGLLDVHKYIRYCNSRNLAHSGGKRVVTWSPASLNLLTNLSPCLGIIIRSYGPERRRFPPSTPLCVH